MSTSKGHSFGRRFLLVSAIIFLIPGFIKAEVDFNGTPRSGFRPLRVTFIDHSSWDASLTRQWSFEGGAPATATGLNVATWYYTAGVYNVTLSIMSGGKVVETLTEEDYITVYESIDYGDAPDFAGGPTQYKTLLASDGAAHEINNLWLGSGVDPELDGHPSLLADGDDLAEDDDEDGVTFGGILLPGADQTITVVAQESGYLNAWFDWGRDGDWAEAEDHVITDHSLTTGSHTVTFSVPASAVGGSTYARFRYSPLTGTGWYGRVYNGEVEDYRVFVSAGDLDFGDAPTPYPTLLADDGARHPNTGPYYLGEGVPTDIEPDGLPDAVAQGDDNNGSDDENGISVPELTPGETNSIMVVAHGAGYLNMWIDFNRDGDWNDAGEKAADGVVMGAILNSVSFPVPSDADPGPTYLRMRYSGDASLEPTGEGGPGEVEDFIAHIVSPEDFGDAPAPYPTLSADDGASHPVSREIYMGSSIPDQEGDGQPQAAALGDDSDGFDDEDGVIIPPYIIAGGSVDIPITVHGTGYLHAWIDLNQDNDWADEGEEVIESLPLGTGTYVHTLTLPLEGVVLGHNFMRFRYCPDVKINATGSGSVGEVEDYLINIDVSEEESYDYGDAPASYGDPRHRIHADIYMGGEVPDAEAGSQPTAGADGDDSNDVDDEDGIHFTDSFVPGHSVGVSCHVMAPGTLDSFFDWNQDGDFTDLGEGPFSIFFAGVGPSAGGIMITIPGDALIGTTYARFRYNYPSGPVHWGEGAASLSPTEEGGYGEVEDYQITVEPSETYDYGDVPLIFDLGDPASHPVSEDIYIGEYVDAESGPQAVDPNATGDDITGSPDDEDGAIFSLFSPGVYAYINVQCHIAEGVTGYLYFWIDFNQDNDWNDPGEEIMNGWEMTAGHTGEAYHFPIPDSAPLGYHYARIRLSEGRLTGPSGSGGNGEVEDYLLPFVLDFGDAPPPYPTVGATGASHKARLGPTLGDGIDGEFSGMPSIGAEGDDMLGTDDEDGVTIPLLTPGSPAVLHVTSHLLPSGLFPTYLNGWIDFNGDGDWADPGEKVFDDYHVEEEDLDLAINVPGTAVPGHSYARFRIQETAGIGFSGPGETGEVEDYLVTILEGPADFGDAPDGIEGLNYPTLLGHGGAYHLIVDGVHLGSAIDGETDGQPQIQAMGDDAAGSDDEDGIQFTAALTHEADGRVTVTASVDGYLNAWADFSADGDWTDPNEYVFFDMPVHAGSNSLTFCIPPWALLEKVYFRFRFTTYRFIEPAGLERPATDGEVEDYLVTRSVSGQTGLKWSQPPLFSSQSHYPDLVWGRGTESVKDTVAADNWFCGDERPVKVIRWWGSYDEWASAVPPSNAPQSFRLRIWSDDPVDVLRGESVPGPMLWEKTVTRAQAGETADGGCFYPGVTGDPDTLFRYQVNLSASDWFEQEEDSTYFWLSIEAVYAGGTVPVEHGWGWTTREAYFLSDAVEMQYDPIMTEDPPTIETLRTGWDCAFELLTDVMERPFDFGDAPGPEYPTSLTENGAHHYVWEGTSLGELLDTEPDSPGDETYTWDDEESTDDEDGITFQDTLYEANDIAYVTVNANEEGILNAWADFNGDGDWKDAGERILIDMPCVAGNNNLAFNIASDVSAAETAVRFRIAPVGGLRSTGLAIGGEVEDEMILMEVTTGVETPEKDAWKPAEFELMQNYPNPFNPSTTIRFRLAEMAEVKVVVHDILGREVRTLVHGEWSAGTHEVVWDGMNGSGVQAATGVYIVRVECASLHGQRELFRETRKMLMLK